MFMFRKMWRGLFSRKTRFEICPFALLPTKWFNTRVVVLLKQLDFFSAEICRIYQKTHKSYVRIFIEILACIPKNTQELCQDYHRNVDMSFFDAFFWLSFGLLCGSSVRSSMPIWCRWWWCSDASGGGVVMVLRFLWYNKCAFMRRYDRVSSEEWSILGTSYCLR